MIKDLVHADPLPAEQQNGQLTAVLAALRQYERVMSSLPGCSDGNCVIRGPRGGQHTNGGCRCSEDRMMARRAMSAALWLRIKLRAALASPNDEGKAE